MRDEGRGQLYEAEERNQADGHFSSKPGRGAACRAVGFVAHFVNMHLLFDAARFAHLVPKSQRRGPMKFCSRRLRVSRFAGIRIAALAAAGWFALGPAAAQDASLSRIGRAPEFTLTTQDGNRLSLKELRGKVVVVTFFFTSCKDSCPLLIHKMAALQPRLGADFGPEVFFLSISVDPKRDTPAVLKQYAEDLDANLSGWAFLTGPEANVRSVVRRYGAFFRKMPSGNVEHSFLTSVVDRSGWLRVQYLGVRFDSNELLKDIQSLLSEGRLQ